MIKKTNLAKGAVDNIIKESLELVDLPLDNLKYISKKAICSRVNRLNIHRMKDSFDQSSPMAPLNLFLLRFAVI
jgi:hypothetical protein